jgi:hypothetical protein
MMKQIICILLLMTAVGSKAQPTNHPTEKGKLGKSSYIIYFQRIGKIS